MTVQDTTMVYTGVPPASSHFAPATKATARIDPAEIECTGVRYFLETRARFFENGRPPSREKANIIRDTEVTVASPHSHCEMKIARYRTNFRVGWNWLSSAQKKTGGCLTGAWGIYCRGGRRPCILPESTNKFVFP